MDFFPSLLTTMHYGIAFSTKCGDAFELSMYFRRQLNHTFWNRFYVVNMPIMP